MSGLPVRGRIGQPRAQTSIYESTTSTRRILPPPRAGRAAAAQGAHDVAPRPPQSGLRHPSTAIPTTSSSIPTSAQYSQGGCFPRSRQSSQIMSRLKLPQHYSAALSQASRSPSYQSASRLAIPKAVQLPPSRPLPARNQPRSPNQRMGLRVADPRLGAIPKTISKQVIVAKEVKSGTHLSSTSTSRKITTEGYPKLQEERSSRLKYQRPSMLQQPRRGKQLIAPSGKKTSSTVLLPSQAGGRIRDVVGTFEKPETENTEEWTQAIARTSTLEKELESSLLEAAAAQHPAISLVGTTSRRSCVAPPMMMTADRGPIPVDTQIITTKSVTKQPGQPDIIGKDVATIERIDCQQAERSEIVMSRAVVTPRKPGLPSSKTKESVIVQEKIAISPGYRQTVKTVTYEGDSSDIRRATVLPSPEEVAKLVEEESEMINETLALRMPEVKHVSPINYSVRKKQIGYTLGADVSQLEDHAICTACVDDARPPEPAEAATPEMIAQIMNTEERGLIMGDAPTNVYNYLFSEENQDPIIQVNSAATYPLNDVLVPNRIPNMTMDVPNLEEVLDAALHAAASAPDSISDNSSSSYCKVVGAEPLQSKNAARKGNRTKRKRVTLLAKEKPPWTIEEVAPVIDLVGAPLAEDRTARDDAELEVDPLEEGIEYLLQQKAPQCYSQIQMRGSQKPDWFPGYYLALPEIPSLIQLAKSPSEVFAAAWRATQPNIFRDDSLYVI